jgi:hypothetical protein
MAAWTSEVVSANGYHTHSVCLLVILVDWGILVCFFQSIQYQNDQFLLISNCATAYDILVS